MSNLRTTLYDAVLGAAAGFSLAFFAWIIADRMGGDGNPPFWPFAVVGVFAGVALLRWLRSRRSGGRWIHLLWVPVVLFVVLMTMIVLALRNFQ